MQYITTAAALLPLIANARMVATFDSEVVLSVTYVWLGGNEWVEMYPHLQLPMGPNGYDTEAPMSAQVNTGNVWARRFRMPVRNAREARAEAKRLFRQNFETKAA